MTPAEYDLWCAFEENGPQPIQFDDVKRVDAQWSDGSDEPSFAWLLELVDGRWASGIGSHDYTGWGCQSSFEVRVFPTREEAIRFGLTLNDRENLGLLLPDDQGTK